MPNLSAYPSVFIYGVPGSGKTTFAQEELNKRLALGHEVIVLDPHVAYGAWPCCSVIGGGMNYQAINDKLDWLFTILRTVFKQPKYHKTRLKEN